MSEYCDWVPLLQKNMTVSIGKNPCQVTQHLCFPKMRISACAHCWMRDDECFRDCALYREYLDGLVTKNACWEAYNSADKKSGCVEDEQCWWDTDTGQCTGRVSAME